MITKINQLFFLILLPFSLSSMDNSAPTNHIKVAQCAIKESNLAKLEDIFAQTSFNKTELAKLKQLSEEVSSEKSVFKNLSVPGDLLAAGVAISCEGLSWRTMTLVSALVVLHGKNGLDCQKSATIHEYICGVSSKISDEK